MLVAIAVGLFLATPGARLARRGGEESSRAAGPDGFHAVWLARRRLAAGDLLRARSCSRACSPAATPAASLGVFGDGGLWAIPLSVAARRRRRPRPARRRRGDSLGCRAPCPLRARRRPAPAARSGAPPPYSSPFARAAGGCGGRPRASVAPQRRSSSATDAARRRSADASDQGDPNEPRQMGGAAGGVRAAAARFRCVRARGQPELPIGDQRSDAADARKSASRYSTTTATCSCWTSTATK